ncbi:MAG TPA: aminotransferase class I/II-fold pyridoxal phosphate-dependent enzyme [Longimicrobiales bacterium]|nr:aminotransferase class I/II-fold pyridoxal phosphate-dependent enzyme [Longimicrobiales bacterium]
MIPARSRNLESLPGYPLAGFKEARMALQARGVDVIDLGAGDADLAPPPAVVAAIQRAVEIPAMSRYPFQVGLPAFRQEVSGWMERRFGVTVDKDREMLPLIGSKDGLAHLPFGYLNPGDVAIIPDPGYQAYLGGTVLAGGEPYLVPLREEHDFLIPLEAIPSDVVKRAKLLFLNYPNNPTAASAPVEYYRRAIDFCREHGIVLIHDHAYSEIAFDGYRPPSILELEGARQVAIEFHSLSKTYNMTGWRMAWAVGNQELIATLSRVKSFVDTGAFLGVQAAGVAALQSWASWVPGNVGVFQARRDRAVDAFRGAGFDVTVPKATMYLWIPVPTHEPSRDFARRCLDQEGVMVLPGSSLGDGGEGFFRIALTVPEDRLEEAANRLKRLL